MINVLIASDNKSYGEALIKMLKKAPDVYKVLDLVDLDNVLNIAVDFQPEMMICAVQNREMPYILLKEIKDICPQTRLILMFEQDDANISISAMKAGVDACLGQVTPGYLVCLMELIALGSVLVFPRVVKPKLKKVVDYSQQSGPDLLDDLTGREKEIYRLLLKNYSNSGISEALGISESTVKVHVRNILKKTGDKSRGALVFSGFIQ
ncbi:MAG: Transcriptional regulatory protein DegU [Pelotomaculum sp. PtaB.Bin104]|nr:MAG: Transcriptional regulatory protein DegU [Pelotomaculum sp. PtaB.Bin104]